MRGPARLATYIGIAMMLGGFALIGLAWSGASALGHIQGQFPYLLSGGLSGLGLIGAGAGLLFVQTLREIDAGESRQFDQVIEGLGRITTALRGGTAPPMTTVAGPSPAPSVAAQDATMVTAWAPPSAQPLVVVGRSSFHDPSCHLVSSRDDLDLHGRDEAVADGLRPCRICKP